MLREILDRHGIGIVVQPEEITTYFQRNSLRPDLVITDSQVFGKIAPWIPQDIPFTSFSIILAHHKGNFDRYLAGTSRIPELKDGDRILLLESCSHHVSCEDIGRHNALDKAVGSMLLAGVPLSECVLYTSGRVPMDMVRKAIRAGVPALVSKTMPTVQSLELAQEYGLQLLCGRKHPLTSSKSAG